MWRRRKDENMETKDLERMQLYNAIRRARDECKRRSCYACGLRHRADCKYELITDELIKNGVFVPRCKVGNIAYFVIEDTVAGTRYVSPEVVVDVTTKGFYTSGHSNDNENGDLWLWSDVDVLVFFDEAKALEIVEGKGEIL